MKRSKSSVVLTILGIAMGTGLGVASAEDVQVNTYTTSFQERPAVALSENGDFVIVWTSGGSAGSDVSGSSIQGQRYAPDGTPIDGQFQVNTETLDDQAAAAVTIDADGDFVVVWDQRFSSPDTIQGQRFAADGAPQGDQFRISNDEFNYEFDPSIAASADGDFVVVWNTYRPDLPPTGEIYGQLFASDGSPVGRNFQVNTSTTGLQGAPSVASDAEGDFVVVWAGPEIRGQRYRSTGAPLGGEFQINTYTTSSQLFPSVTMDSDGDFIVSWQSEGSVGTDTSGASIQAQRFASDGTRVGGELQVNAYTTDDQREPSVAMNAAGDFVVVWQSTGSSSTDTAGISIQAQRFASDGSEVGAEYQVNSYTLLNQMHATVALDALGDPLVTWTSEGSASDDTDGTSIQRTSRTLIFADGFESGDTSAWSGDR